MQVKIGDNIIVAPIGNNTRYSEQIYEGKISKIGRKWFNVDTGNYIGEHNKFSMEDGRCDGKNYMPEWQVFTTIEEYKEVKEAPKLRNQVEKELRNLSYRKLKEIIDIIQNENI